ncbi:MAG: vitamin K epoxide reductase family protein [Armatimonadetes bacterium]|nr:vitamin K epoxide reductase family protein [Armatimonadota bacterium]
MPPSKPRARASTVGTSGSAWLAAAAVAVAGIAVSGYLLFSYARNIAPVCLAGPCAEVATSSYARFLGIPNAALGLMLYVAVAAVAIAALSRVPVRSWASPVMFGLGVFGATFSVYLTWLQVAVLQAVCAWCALSAVLWVVMLVLSVVIARRGP